MITAFVRTIILYFLIVVGMRLMGKRQIGELEPSELVLTMMISDLAAVPMQDFGIPLLSGLLPILTLLALSLLLSQLSLRSLRLRALICGTPTVLIRGGKLQQADAQAQSEAWTEAVDTLAGSYDDWSESQTYLHIVARHDTVDDAEAMYRRALAFAATRELTEFRAEISDLRDQLRLLAETERLDIKNVL